MSRSNDTLSTLWAYDGLIPCPGELISREKLLPQATITSGRLIRVLQEGFRTGIISVSSDFISIDTREHVYAFARARDVTAADFWETRRAYFHKTASNSNFWKMGITRLVPFLFFFFWLLYVLPLHHLLSAALSPSSVGDRAFDFHRSRAVVLSAKCIIPKSFRSQIHRVKYHTGAINATWVYVLNRIITYYVNCYITSRA